MGMQKLFVLALLATMLSVAFGQPARADDAARFTALLSDPGLRQSVINAAGKSTVILQNPCPTAQYRVALEPIIVKPIVFDGAGHPTGGTLKFPVKEEGCGVTRLLNVMAWVPAPRTLETAPLAPGTTIADLALQIDAAKYAYIAANGAAHPDTACKLSYVSDTEFIAREKAGPSGPASWRENWTVVLCDKKVVVPVTFSPDATGTTISTNVSGTKVSRVEAAPH